MAKSLSKSNIVTNNTILASDVSQSIDALTGTVAYDIKISGSLQNTGSVDIQGLLTATAGITHQLTASNAVSSSYAITSSYIDNIPASALPSGLLSSSAQIATEISGAFGAASASFSTRVSANETNISTNTTNITTLTSKTGSYATTGSNQFNGDQQITGSLIVSGSTTSTIDTARLRVGGYFANGGVAVSNAEELYISGSGIQRAVIESSNTSAVLQLRSPSGQSTVIDFEEGGQQRWVVGVSASNDNFVIATGSALSTGVLFQIDRTSKDVEIINNLSASAVSASTYYGDGSNLKGIVSGFWTGSNGTITRDSDVKITGSLTITGSLIISGSTPTQILGSGKNSTRIGLATTASHENSIAIGTSTFAGLHSIAVGSGSQAPQENQVVIGNLSDGGIGAKTVTIGYKATGSIQSVVIGDTAGGPGSYSVALGANSLTKGAFGISLGVLAQANENSGIAIGYLAQTSGSTRNIAMGYNAKAIGSYTVSIGYYPGHNNDVSGTSGQLRAINIGYLIGSNQAIANNTTYNRGNDVNIGYYAGAGQSSALRVTQSRAVNIGDQAGMRSSTHEAIAIGYAAGAYRTDYGSQAAINANQQEGNIHIGGGAGLDGHGDYNVNLGYQAGYVNYADQAQVTASYGTTIGTKAGFYASYDRSTFVGYQAGQQSYNDYSIIIGTDAGVKTTGSYNLYIGYDTAYLVTGSNNVIIGPGVTGASQVTLNKQLRIGSGSITAISASLETGDVIFASTASAAYLSTTAGNLSSISASYALTASHALNSGGSTFPFNGDAVITGSLTVGDNSANDFDIIVDGGSIQIKRQNNNILRDYTSPGFSSGGAVIFGYRALGSQQGKNQTVAIGRDAGFAQLNSDYAVFMGYAAGGSSGTGDADQSTMIGAEAGYKAKAAGNTFLGYRAGYDIASGTNNIIIGHYAASGSGDLSSQLRIGSGSLTAISASLNTGDIIFPSTASAAYISASNAVRTNKVTFDEDANSYIEVNDTDSIRIVAGGQQMIVFDHDTGDRIITGFGKDVGIGIGNTSTPGANLHVLGNIWASGSNGHITASGDISASGTIIAEDGNIINNLTVGGNLDIADTIYHTGDSNTKIRFPEADTISFHTAGVDRLRISPAGHITASGNISSSANITGNILNIGTRVKAIGSSLEFAGNTLNFVDGSSVSYLFRGINSGAFEAYYAGNKKFETTSTGVSITGSITASGVLEIADIITTDLTITSSGTVLPTIESSNGIAALKLKSGGSHAYIDMDEGADQRWIAGMYTNDNSYRIASGSAFASNTLFELDQDGKIEIQSNLSSSAASTASFGTYIGDGSQLSNISSTPFPFVGDAVITGSLTISGSQAFVLDSSNVVLGQNAGGGTVDTGTDDANVIIGKDAAGGGALNDGDNNIVIGHEAGYALSTGDNNIIIGFEAGKVNTATANTFIGSRSGQKNTTGYYNTFVGRDSGMECVEWQNNTYIGYAAGRNPRDEMNTAVGAEAMYGASGANTAEQNVAMGYRALYAIASNGDGNVAIGWKAGDSITSGTDNIAIGYNADVSGTGANQIAIGDGVTTTGDGDIKIGNQSGLIPFSGSSVTGDVLFPSTASAAYFSGDGSNLTNVVAFPFVGDAVITGSLIVSSSNSTSSLSLQGSGSTVFDVAGSQGQLFSVTDDLSGTLFEANNISGLPVIQAKADNTVHLGKWNGYGITISGSTPDPSDASAKIMITGSVRISGSISHGGIVTLTNDPGAYTLGNNEHFVLVDAASGNVSITMPSASLYPGRQIFFKCIGDGGSSVISFSGSAAEKVEFANRNILTAFNDVSESISLVSDGTSNWYLF